jgi:hypothetical protein
MSPFFILRFSPRPLLLAVQEPDQQREGSVLRFGQQAMHDATPTILLPLDQKVHVVVHFRVFQLVVRSTGSDFIDRDALKGSIRRRISAT